MLYSGNIPCVGGFGGLEGGAEGLMLYSGNISCVFGIL